MNFTKLNELLNVVETSVIYIVVVALGTLSCFYVPPLYLLLITAILLSLEKKYLGGEFKGIKSALTAFLFPCLVATMILLYSVFGGELNGMVSTSFGNHDIRLTKLPFSYLFTGTR